MLITRLPENMAGRDMVIGDLHAHLDDLNTLLAQSGFNPETDRLFSTGDLIDRGPDSPGCLDLLWKPWFYPVAGNHEMMLLDHIADFLSLGEPSVRVARERLESALKPNGADWFMQAYLNRPSDDHWNKVAERIHQMPNLFVVGKGVPRFHVIHGDLFLGSSILDDDAIDALERDIGSGGFNSWDMKSMSQHVVWSRTLSSMVSWGACAEPFQDGLSITYCGHSIVPEPTFALSHCLMDTGSGLQQKDRTKYGLTLVVLDNGYPVKAYTTKESR